MSIEALTPGSIEKDRVDVERTAFKHTKKFSWRAVSARVIRELLTVAYDEKPDEVRKLKKQSEKRLTELAHSIYGSPPTMGRLDFYPGAWEVLQHTWAVREADRGLLGHLVNWASLGVPVSEREPDMHTLKDLRGFVARRNKTDNFKANLRKFFIHTRFRNRCEVELLTEGRRVACRYVFNFCAERGSNAAMSLTPTNERPRRHSTGS